MKKRFLTPVLAVMAVLGVSFAALAFKTAEPVTEKSSFVNWYFTLEEEPDGENIYDPANYSQTAPANCGGETQIPCQIQYTGTNLASYLAGLESTSQPVPVLTFKAE